MKRAVFWLLLICFIAACAFWTFRIRPGRSLMYRAVPAEATYISVHQDLAGRWDDFCSNPLAQSLFNTLGLSAEDTGALSSNANFRAVLDRLASDELVLAYVPNFGYLDAPAWVFASWVGPRDVLLRWFLDSGRMKEIKPIARQSGWGMWSVLSPDLPLDQYTQLAVGDGVLMGCISSDPRGVRRVLDTYDGRRFSIADIWAGLNNADVWTKPPCMDRGWALRKSWDSPGTMFELERVDEFSLAGSVLWGGEARGAGSPGAALQSPSLVKLFGDLPIAAVVADAGSVSSWLRGVKGGVVLKAFNHLLSAEPSRAVAAGLFAGDYSGRYLGIKLPGLVVGIQVEGHDEARTELLSVLDRLNAEYRLGLIARDTLVGDDVVYMIEATNPCPYSKLSYRERMACTYLGGWLLISSNYETLEKLLQRYAEWPLSSDGEPPAWTSGISQRTSTGYGWIDLVKGGKSLRLALSAYSFRMALKEDRGDSQARRKRIAAAKAWIDALAPLEVSYLWLQEQGAWTRLRFAAGPDGGMETND